MTAEEFVDWFKGFIDGAHKFNITPAQWDHLKDKIKEGEEKNTIVDYTCGDYVMNHTWE